MSGIACLFFCPSTRPTDCSLVPRAFSLAWGRGKDRGNEVELSTFVSVQFSASFYLPIYLSFLSFCPSVCLSVYLSVDRFTMLFSTFRILIEVPSSFRADQYSVLTGSKDCSMKIWSLSSGKLSPNQTFVADNFLSLRCSCTTLKVCCETLGLIFA